VHQLVNKKIDNIKMHGTTVKKNPLSMLFPSTETLGFTPLRIANQPHYTKYALRCSTAKGFAD